MTTEWMITSYYGTVSDMNERIKMRWRFVNKCLLHFRIGSKPLGEWNTRNRIELHRSCPLMRRSGLSTQDIQRWVSIRLRSCPLDRLVSNDNRHSRRVFDWPKRKIFVVKFFIQIVFACKYFANGMVTKGKRVGEGLCIRIQVIDGNFISFLFCFSFRWASWRMYRIYQLAWD